MKQTNKQETDLGKLELNKLNYESATAESGRFFPIPHKTRTPLHASYMKPYCLASSAVVFVIDNLSAAFPKLRRNLSGLLWSAPRAYSTSLNLWIHPPPPARCEFLIAQLWKRLMLFSHQSITTRQPIRHQYKGNMSWRWKKNR